MEHLVRILPGWGLSVLSAVAAGELIAPRLPLPRAIRFTAGAAVYSLLVFALLACGAGYLWVYAALCGALCSLAWRRRAARSGSLPSMPWAYRILFGTAAALYFIYALAPETQPDAAGYHLRIVGDYVRLHGFSRRSGFYDVLPQGLEMLFVPAFALGAHSAARLVHFTFLLAVIPLMRGLASELGYQSSVGLAAAALLFLAPVSGVAGTSAYTDLALLCGVCSALYLLIRWDRERTAMLLALAGLQTAFCYSVKPTFVWIAPAALAFILFRSRKPAPAALFIGVAILFAIPWPARAWVLTGNPLAPAFSGLDIQLAQRYSAFRDSFAWRTALFDYTVLGGNQGLLGPAFLLLPAALFALRRKTGRQLIAAAAILLVPVLANTGTRFLLPAMAPAAIALVSVLPPTAAIALVAIQAIGSAPPIVALYDRRGEWFLGDPPVEAALRLIPERQYLADELDGFAAVRMIERQTPVGARIFVCASLPESYLPRETLVYWQSERARRIADAIHFAMMSQGTRARLLSWRWREDRYRSVRLTALSELRIVEAALTGGGRGVSSWTNYQPGEVFRMGDSKGATGANLLIWPGDQALARTEGLGASGVWSPIDGEAERSALNIDVRRDAAAYVRRSGYGYIAIPAKNDPFAAIGQDMLAHEAAWGVRRLGHAGGLWLFEIVDEPR